MKITLNYYNCLKSNIFNSNNYSNMLLKTIFSLLLVACISTVSAIIIPVQPSGVITNPNVSSSPVMQVQDYNYSSFSTSGWDLNMKNISQKNIARFWIDRGSSTGHKHIYEKGTIEIIVKVTGFKAINGGLPTAFTVNKTVTLAFDTGIVARETDKVSIVVEDAIFSQIEITSVKWNGTSTPWYGVAGYPDIKVENTIESERIYKFAALSPPPVVAFPSIQTIYPNSASPSRDQWIKMNWTSSFAYTGVEEFEIEYLFMNLPSGNSNFPGSITPPTLTSLPYNFKNNCTRIILPAGTTSYEIPNLYPEGLLIWRFRVVGKELSDPSIKIYSPWNLNTSGLANASVSSSWNGVWLLKTMNPNPQLSWNLDVSYAEDGKKAVSITYFDGTLRAREAVAYSASTNKYIVAQQIYDYLGRTALNVAPSISMDNLGFAFRSKFNQNSANSQYHFEDFDFNKLGSKEIEVDKLSMNSGAAKFLSPNFKFTNDYMSLDDATKRMHDFMPDAGGYAFSQVEFTRDPSGRTWRQGGMGPTHQLKAFLKNTGTWVDGKETKAYDGTPTQTELDMLFGNEVGVHQKYKKVMTVDPNGQLSVAYIDPYGRTIATALAGDPANTPNLDPLPSSNHYVDIKDKFVNTLLDKQSGSKKILSNFIATVEGYYKIYYEIDRQQFELCETDICFECVYDLTISVTNPNDYNAEMMPGGTPLKVTLGSVERPSAGCGTEGNLHFNLNPNPILVYLKPGEYFISKDLSINQQAKAAMRQQFLDEAACITPYRTFIAAEFDKMGLSCEMDCDDCDAAKSDIQATIDDITNYCTANSIDKLTYEPYIEATNDLKDITEACKDACVAQSPCETLYDAILMDMQPSGQYAEYTAENSEGEELGLSSVVNPTIFKVNSTQNWWCSSQDFNTQAEVWRQPRNLDPNATIKERYLNEDGSEARIPVSLVNGTYIPLNNGVYTDNVTGEKYTFPHLLQNTSDFITYYQNNLHWSAQLAVYHPEYCLYENCKTIEATLVYDQKLNSESSAVEAAKKGYYNPLQMSSLGCSERPNLSYSSHEGVSNQIERDPIFADPNVRNKFTTAELNDLEARLTNVVNCGSATNKSIWCLYEDRKSENGVSSWNACVEDAFWPLLRSLYISTKQQWIQDWLSNRCPSGGSCSTNCAGIRYPRFKIGTFGNMAGKVPNAEMKNNGWFDPTRWNGVDPCDKAVVSQKMDEQVKDHCKTQCEGNVKVWLEKLDPCLTSSFPDPTTKAAKIVLLTAALQKMCEGGCDLNNPYGSTSINPNLQNLRDNSGNLIYLHKSIAEVLADPNILGANWFSAGLCDDLLIDFPGDYGHDYLAYEAPGMEKCACEQDKNIRNGVKDCCPETIETNNKIIDDCACDLDENLKELRLSIINVPESQRCQNCITCKELEELTVDFTKRYPSFHTSEDVESMQKIMSNYFNRKLGFNLQYLDYYNFALDCLGDNAQRTDWFKAWQDLKVDRLGIWKEGTIDYQLQIPEPFVTSPRVQYATQLPEREPLYMYNRSINTVASIYDNTSGSAFNAAPYQTAGLNDAECNCKNIMAVAKLIQDNQHDGLTAVALYTRLYGSYPFTGNFEDLKNKCCEYMHAPQPPPTDCPSDWSYGKGFTQEGINQFNQENNGSNPVVTTLNENPCTPSTEAPTLVDLDDCACKKFKAEQSLWQADPVYGEFGTQKLTYAAWLQKKFGVTASQAELMLAKCEEAFLTGVDYDKNNDPSETFTANSNFQLEALYNLKQWAEDLNLKVPKAFACNEAVVEPPCYDDIPCSDLQFFMFSEISSKMNVADGNGVTLKEKVELPDFGNGDHMQTMEKFFWEFMDWTDALEPNISGTNNLTPGTRDYERAEFLRGLLDKYRSKIKCPPPAKQANDYTLSDFMKKMMGCLGGNVYTASPQCARKANCAEAGLLIKNLLAGSTAWPGYTNPVYSEDNVKYYVRDFYDWLGAYKANSNPSQAEKDWYDAVTAAFNADPKLNSCYPDKTFPLESLLPNLWDCFPAPKGTVQQPCCATCYGPNTEWNSAYVDFLNKVNKKVFPNKVDRLTHKSWFLESTKTPQVFEFGNSVLYAGGTDRGNLKYEVDRTSSSSNFMPTLGIKIKDNNGFSLKYTISFPTNEARWNYKFIQSFQNLRPVKTKNCSKPRYMYIDAVYKVPDLYWKDKFGNAIEPYLDCPNTIPPGSLNYEWCYSVVTLLVEITEYTANAGNSVAKTIPCPNCNKLCNKPFNRNVIVPDEDCEEETKREAMYNALLQYRQHIEKMAAEFDKQFADKCFNPNNETFELEYKLWQYHYTLYYYDQAGQLIKTVPPAGVDIDNENLSQTQRQALVEDRAMTAGLHRVNPVNNPRAKTYHSLITNYKYNSLGLLTWQFTPDGGISHTWYDALSRPILSQNSRQAQAGKYSYMKYDYLGRAIETGETQSQPFNYQEYAYFHEFSDATVANNAVSVNSSGPMDFYKIGQDAIIDLHTISGIGGNNTYVRVTPQYTTVTETNTETKINLEPSKNYTVKFGVDFIGNMSLDCKITSYTSTGVATVLTNTTGIGIGIHSENITVPSNSAEIRIVFKGHHNSFNSTQDQLLIDNFSAELSGSQEYLPTSRRLASAGYITSFLAAGQHREVFSSSFDVPFNATRANLAFPEGIKNTRNRPVSQCFEEVDDNNSQTYDVASLMSYDIHGNIIKAVKDIPVLSHLIDGYFSIETEFDLLTGKTNKITLQKGKRDQWIHKYYYDRDNRITSVYTSRDAINWENDAKYFYNLAGSLARTELGELKVQGLDYASTINGWIKGVNGGSMTPEFDIGKDGHNDPSNTNRFVGRDAFGYVLSFFNEDYINISGQHLDANRTGSDLAGKTNGRELFNGNIMHMQVALPRGRGANSWVGNNDPSKLSRELVAEVLGSVYHYDQLNRITKHYSFDEFAAPSTGTQYLGGTWLNSGKSGMQKYYENFAYDANGNITSLNRNSGTIPTGATDYKMDEMTYNYDKVTVSITLQQNTSITYSLLNLQSNKLYKVDDNVNATFYKDDIDAQAVGNYSYDNLGNLIQDDAEEIDEIKWTNSGKIKSVKRVNTSAKADLQFGYDEAGQRLWKLVIPKEEILPASTPKTYKNKKQEYWDTTWYLGSARYSVQHVRNTNVPDDLYKQWVLEELDIVGEKRHGLYKPQEVIGQRNLVVNAELDYNEDGTFNFSNSWQNTQNSGKFVPLRDEEVRIMIRGCKQYELSNHLGNVLVTVSDRKSSRASSTTATLAEYYVPYVLTISDYYAFGSSIKERTVSFSATYRYGFNNQEQDVEMGEYYAFEYRIHDARLGRFLSVDPLEKDYVWQSTYAYFRNCPIKVKDLLGLGGPYEDFESIDGIFNILNQTAAAEVCPSSKISAPPGYKEYTAIGGRTIYLPSTAQVTLHTESTTSIKLGDKVIKTEAKVGEVHSFTDGGKKYLSYFDEDGRFTDYKNWSGGVVYKPKFMLDGVVYTCNSLQTFRGRDDNCNINGAFSGIYKLTNEDMAMMAGWADYVFYDKHMGKIIETTIKQESVGGRLDYKNILYDILIESTNREDLIMFDGIVYNANEIGNLIWGFVLTQAGSFINPNWIAETGTANRHDEAWEQRAITIGKNAAEKTEYNSADFEEAALYYRRTIKNTIKITFKNGKK